MTSYEVGDIVLAPFPFTDLTTAKQRPAVVVSSVAYNTNRPDVILMPITSQPGPVGAVGEVTIVQWQAANFTLSFCHQTDHRYVGTDTHPALTWAIAPQRSTGA